MSNLKGSVALVAGATRGAGRGIARALGEAGTTVYCTGRSSRAAPRLEENAARPETIEETAELVDAAGGVGIAIRADHTEDAAVSALCARIRAEQGRLDVLVNDIWGGDALTEWGRPFWQLDCAQGFTLLERAVHTHVLTSRHAVPLMLETRSAGSTEESRPPGLIVEVTDGAFAGYRGQLFYDLAKANVIRLAYAMSVELASHPITAVALTPGFLRSEAVLAHFGVREDNWRDAIAKDPHFAHSETPLLIGRVIAALAADPDSARFAGRPQTCWDLARHYDVHDVDGAQPHWDEHLDEAIAAILAADAPSQDDLFLLQARGPQLDFDPTRADQRAAIAAFLARHPEPPSGPA